MKSMMLAIVITMFVSVAYVFQNHETIHVKFLLGQWDLPQGIWEMALLGTGLFLMWLFSLFANYSSKSHYKKQISDLTAKLQRIEEENRQLTNDIDVLKKKNCIDTTNNTDIQTDSCSIAKEISPDLNKEQQSW